MLKLTWLLSFVQGFLPNVRQQRAAGYAALQLAQTVRALLVERAAGREGLWVNRWVVLVGGARVCGWGYAVVVAVHACEVSGTNSHMHNKHSYPGTRLYRYVGKSLLLMTICIVTSCSVPCSEGSSGEGGCSGRHLFGWRDAMDIVVK